MYWCKGTNNQVPVHSNITLKCTDVILPTIDYLPLSKHVLHLCYNCKFVFTNLFLNVGLFRKIP